VVPVEIILFVLVGLEGGFVVGVVVDVFSIRLVLLVVVLGGCFDGRFEESHRRSMREKTSRILRVRILLLWSSNRRHSSFESSLPC